MYLNKVFVVYHNYPYIPMYTLKGVLRSIHGYIVVYKGVHGYIGVYKGIHGYIGVYKGIHRYIGV